MGWAFIFDEEKGYYDLQINPLTKTFTTTNDVGDYTGIIEMLKYTLGTDDDDVNNELNDPNFTNGAPCFAYYENDDPRGIRAAYLINNRKGSNFLQEVKAECERATKPMLGKTFKGKKICQYLVFNPQDNNGEIVVDISIGFTDNTVINTKLILNSLSNELR